MLAREVGVIEHALDRHRAAIDDGPLATLAALGGFEIAALAGFIEQSVFWSQQHILLPDEDLEAQLLALPGVGPYAAAHIMMTVGRHSRLILDSWTRPKYARLLGRKTVADATIRRRFRRFGPEAGLAFWLFVTQRLGGVRCACLGLRRRGILPGGPPRPAPRSGASER